MFFVLSLFGWRFLKKKYVERVLITFDEEMAGKAKAAVEVFTR